MHFPTGGACLISLERRCCRARETTAQAGCNHHCLEDRIVEDSIAANASSLSRMCIQSLAVAAVGSDLL